MAGKSNKTRVTLPGSLADLVRDLQDGNAQTQKTAEATQTQRKLAKEPEHADEDAQTAQQQEAPQGGQDGARRAAEPVQEAEGVAEPYPSERANRPIGSERQRPQQDEKQQRGRPQKENTMREYHIQKDDSADSWDLFLDLAKQYKTGGGRPATIYIDPALKNILDRLKYPLSLTTSSILSSIVARFIYDHEDDVRKAIFSQNIF